MGLPDHSSGPGGSYGPIVVLHSPPISGCIPHKTRQDSTSPYASSVGVVEDRSVLMTFFKVRVIQPIARGVF